MAIRSPEASRFQARRIRVAIRVPFTAPLHAEPWNFFQFTHHGIAELAKHVDSLITIPNQKLLTVLGPKTRLLDAFQAANGVLQGAVQGIADLITRPGLINVDFADVKLSCRKQAWR
mgnify:CR=1 FL=1